MVLGVLAGAFDLARGGGKCLWGLAHRWWPRGGHAHLLQLPQPGTSGAVCTPPHARACCADTGSTHCNTAAAAAPGTLGRSVAEACVTAGLSACSSAGVMAADLLQTPTAAVVAAAATPHAQALILQWVLAAPVSATAPPGATAPGTTTPTLHQLLTHKQGQAAWAGPAVLQTPLPAAADLLPLLQLQLQLQTPLPQQQVPGPQLRGMASSTPQVAPRRVQQQLEACGSLAQLQAVVEQLQGSMRPHHAAQAVRVAGELLRAELAAHRTTRSTSSSTVTTGGTAAGTSTATSDAPAAGSTTDSASTGASSTQDPMAVYATALQLAQRCSSLALGTQQPPQQQPQVQQAQGPQGRTKGQGQGQGVLEMSALRDLLQGWCLLLPSAHMQHLRTKRQPLVALPSREHLAAVVDALAPGASADLPLSPTAGAATNHPTDSSELLATAQLQPDLHQQQQQQQPQRYGRLHMATLPEVTALLRPLAALHGLPPGGRLRGVIANVVLRRAAAEGPDELAEAARALGCPQVGLLDPGVAAALLRAALQMAPSSLRSSWRRGAPVATLTARQLAPLLDLCRRSEAAAAAAVAPGAAAPSAAVSLLSPKDLDAVAEVLLRTGVGDLGLGELAAVVSVYAAGSGGAKPLLLQALAARTAAVASGLGQHSRGAAAATALPRAAIKVMNDYSGCTAEVVAAMQVLVREGGGAFSEACDQLEAVGTLLQGFARLQYDDPGLYTSLSCAASRLVPRIRASWIFQELAEGRTDVRRMSDSVRRKRRQVLGAEAWQRVGELWQELDRHARRVLSAAVAVADGAVRAPAAQPPATRAAPEGRAAAARDAGTLISMLAPPVAQLAMPALPLVASARELLALARMCAANRKIEQSLAVVLDELAAARLHITSPDFGDPLIKPSLPRHASAAAAVATPGGRTPRLEWLTELMEVTTRRLGGDWPHLREVIWPSEAQQKQKQLPKPAKDQLQMVGEEAQPAVVQDTGTSASRLQGEEEQRKDKRGLPLLLRQVLWEVLCGLEAELAATGGAQMSAHSTQTRSTGGPSVANKLCRLLGCLAVDGTLTTNPLQMTTFLRALSISLDPSSLGPLLSSLPPLHDVPYGNRNSLLRQVFQSDDISMPAIAAADGTGGIAAGPRSSAAAGTPARLPALDDEAACGLFRIYLCAADAGMEDAVQAALPRHLAAPLMARAAAAWHEGGWGTSAPRAVAGTAAAAAPGGGGLPEVGGSAARGVTLWSQRPFLAGGGGSRGKDAAEQAQHQARRERQLLSALEALGLPVFERVQSSDGHFLVSCGVALAGASVAVELLPASCVVQRHALRSVRVPMPPDRPLAKAPGPKSHGAEAARNARAAHATGSTPETEAGVGTAASTAWPSASASPQPPTRHLLQAFSAGTPAGVTAAAISAATAGGKTHTVLNPHWLQQPDGDAAFRQRCLEARGWRVVVLPAAEWDAAWGAGGMAAAAALVSQRLASLLAELQRQPPQQQQS